MSWPPFVDEVAIVSLPFDDPQIYEALTDRTRVRSWSRGRQSEAVRTDTGQSSTVFDNSDRALDPENAASPYYPNVKPMRRIRCTVEISSTTYYLFTHFIDPTQGLQLTQDTPGYAEVTIPANDGFDVLATSMFTDVDTLPQEKVASRINRILDRFDWPAGERAIDDVDEIEIQGAGPGDLTGQSALDQIQGAADTDAGVFFIDGRGYAVYHSRYYALLNDRAKTSQATFCDFPNLADNDGAFLYTSAPPSSSPVVNDYLITRLGGTQVEALDSDSIDEFRVRSVTLETLHTTDARALDFGRYKVAATRQPHRRYDEMTVEPGNDLGFWEQLFKLEIGDRITIVGTPPGGGDPDQRDMFIEAVKFDVGPGVAATVTFRLSPGSQAIGWIADVSEAGVDTIGIY